MGYVRFLGHAAFEISLDDKLIYIDPWIEGNPQAAITLKEVDKADLIVVTHDHSDHLGNSVALAKKTGAPIVSLYEIAQELGKYGIKTVGANIGGRIQLGNITLYFTPALHTGNCAGVILKGKETTIYHAGDTGVFGDMRLLSELYGIEIALLPIGGHFTMGPVEAAKAVELIRPKVAIPMHYNTFPVIRSDPFALKKLVEEKGIETKIVILSPGEKFKF